MEISHDKINQYHQVTVKDGQTTLEGGLLDRNEALEFAVDLISVSEDLIGGDHAVELQKIREDIEMHLNLDEEI